jgi:hypothetical protein
MMHYMLYRVGFQRAFRMAKLMGIVESQRFKYAPTHYTSSLQTMGTASAQQGKGIGTTS